MKKEKLLHYYIYYLYFILFEVLNATIVENENDVIRNFSTTSNKVTLEINSEIDITRKISINNSIKQLYITGSSPDSARLNLNYPLYFDSNIEKIEIKDLNINGNLFFSKNNKNIIINTVNLNGYIDSNFDYNSNNNIEIIKLNYKPTWKLVENCIYLSGNVKINNSYFFGNSSCQNRLLHYNGFKKYQIDLKESNFNGNYECPFLSIKNTTKANIESSYFEKGYSSKYIDGGVGMVATYSNIVVKNCTFNDIISYNDGGAFNFKNNIQVEGSNLNFNNVTSLGLGSICQISSKEPSKQYFNNIIQKNTGNINNMRGGGLIMNIEDHAEVEINSYYAENLINYETSGSAFIISEYGKLIMKNVFIKNSIGHGQQGGLFYTSQNSLNITFNAYDITLDNLYQLDLHDTSMIYIDTNNNVKMDGVRIFNSGGHNTNLINMLGFSYIDLKNFEIDYFESKTTKELVNFESDQVDLDEKKITNFKVSNIISQGVLFRIQSGFFRISNSEFRNIHECYKYNNCTSINTDKNFIQNVEFLIVYGNDGDTNANMCRIYFDYINIDEMYGDTGIILYGPGTIINNIDVLNSYFKNGFIYMDTINNLQGVLNIDSSKFVNNTSEYGTIFNFNNFLSGTVVFVTVANSMFINNTASKFGGVMYSMGQHNYKHISFTNCNYENNHAKFGNIIYAYSLSTLPNIGILNSSDISTIPVYFKMDGNEGDEINIFSGESIPEGIKFKIYDDFGNQMYFPEETNNFEFEDLVLFNVEVNDTYNAKVLGQTKDYCWDEYCIFPPVKVIGNPGIYTLSLKFKSFGMYRNFVQESIDIEIKIFECNEETHINQAIGNTHLKSCYVAKCEFDCNGGECVNNDVCDCHEMPLKGKYCNEYIKLERYSFLDIIFIIIASIILLILIAIIAMIFLFKNNAIIKGGAIEFLILILIGLIINTVNTIFLTYEKTMGICYQTYLFSNTGFSFVFGSIFVKSFRIYKIFCQERKSLDIGFKKSTMYLIIILITLFHWMMAFSWFYFKEVDAKNDHTADYQEFIRCEYPQSKYISSLFNFSILMLQFVLSYSIRGVEKKFQEDLIIPGYVYIIYMVFMYAVGNQNVINVVIKDYFDIVGTTLNTIASIHYLFITKFIEMFKANKEDKTQTFVLIM